LLLKNGQKHISLYPAPIYLHSLVEMTQQYEQDASLQSIHTILCALLHQGTNSDMTTGLPGLINHFDNVTTCFQAVLSDQVYTDKEDYSKLLVTKLRGDEW